MKVKSILFNWYQTGSVADNSGAGEDYSKFEVGSKGVVKIEENHPKNGDDIWNYLVFFEDKTLARVFNPNYIEYESSTCKN